MNQCVEEKNREQSHKDLTHSPPLTAYSDGTCAFLSSSKSELLCETGSVILLHSLSPRYPPEGSQNHLDKYAFTLYDVCISLWYLFGGYDGIESEIEA